MSVMQRCRRGFIRPSNVVLFVSSLLVLVSGAIAVDASAEEITQEFAMTASAASVVAGGEVTIRVEAVDSLRFRSSGTPVMVTLQRLEDPSTGQPVTPDFEGGVWMPIQGTSRVMTDGVTEYELDMLEYLPGTYVFKATGGMPTEPTTSNPLALQVTAE